MISNHLRKSNENKKLDLVVECEYLGNLDVESKYLTHSIIKWLIAEIKLIDNEKKLKDCFFEVNVNKNNLCLCKKDDAQRQEIFNHKMSEIFKITYLPNDPVCFGYFYRKNNTSFNYYTLHAFTSSKSNLSQVISDFQQRAIKLHENLIYEKLFDFKLVTKLVINQEDLNIPNFIEICLEKANTNNNSNSKSIFTNKLNKLLKLKNDFYLQLLSERRVLLQFGVNKLYLLETNEEPVEQNYKDVLYLNNSITNENFFCLAYSTASTKTQNTPVNALILYSDNVETIDDVIREYAINISSELSTDFKKDQNLDQSATLRPENHSCGLCPMKQFTDLCQYLEKFDDNHYEVYNYLIDKLNNNIDLEDQNSILEWLKDFKIQSENIVEKNQLIVALLHKLCLRRQSKHLIDALSSKNSGNTLVLVNSGLLNSRLSQSVHSNLVKKKKLHRSSTLDSFVETSEIRDKFKAQQTPEFGKMLKLSSSHRSLWDSNSNLDQLNYLTRKSCKKSIFYKIVGSPYTVTQEMHKADNLAKRFRTRHEIRQFWKKVNFSYVEITPCLKEVDKVWQKWLSLEEDCEEFKSINFDEIKSTVFKGIPQSKREKIWFWLIKKHKKKLNNEAKLRLDLGYREILSQSTIHQHAILLDLGRTFPSHPNFSKKYGPGQLALFNVLKAYSILDSEVGYCQGLSFIVGILLIHVNNNEEKAFDLLKFLLVDLNFREQFKPDMVRLQKYMYQFSRFLQENCAEVFNHLENYDLSASLYAAPWFLTLFSSQFQIGFVARVFDFLFAEGNLCLFKFSLAILTIHKPLLLSCDTFESIVSHIKSTIPEMSLIESELIINKAFAHGDIGPELDKYEIEFGVLYEDFSNIQNNIINQTGLSNEMDSIKLKTECNSLKEKLRHIQTQIGNQDSYFYKLHLDNKNLKSRVESLEMEKLNLIKTIQEKDKIINNLMN
ncbi:TBC1 domain family member 1 isoform X4 [Brachionus plicatilis]|uniref:TBC1 domain family member 1 isoform X4 n=1 Tax=Brachionus plicatilis TaxID=10195 RepID=A0A3M7RPS3_BRAPC|nr:TBC1 domain family member 1 isoform X4 [Brachionus plicatilis]